MRKKELIAPREMDVQPVEGNPNVARIVLEPLEPGFGHTLGNALRRTLLSSIPGAAVTEVKIAGVLHEYTTMDAVEEDVLHILLNLKNLVVCLEDVDEVELNIKKKGGGVASAHDIELPANVKILNPDLEIANLGDSGSLEMSITVSSGIGYDPVDSRLRERSEEDRQTEIGRILVDAFYSPVRRVTYRVETTHHERLANLDKLILELETNGTMDPKDAIIQAAKSIQHQLAVFVGMDFEESVSPVASSERSVTDLMLSIEKLELSPRSINCLKSEGVHFLGDLVMKTETDLLQTPKMGKKSLIEIRDALKEVGMVLGTDLKNWPPVSK